MISIESIITSAKQTSKKVTLITASAGLLMALLPSLGASAASAPLNGTQLTFVSPKDVGTYQSDTDAICYDQYAMKDGSEGYPEPGDAQYFSTTVKEVGKSKNVVYDDGYQSGFNGYYGITYTLIEAAITKGDYFVNTSGQRVSSIKTTVVAPAETYYCKDSGPNNYTLKAQTLILNQTYTYDLDTYIKPANSGYGPIKYSDVTVTNDHNQPETNIKASLVKLSGGDTGLQVTPTGEEPANDKDGDYNFARLYVTATDQAGKSSYFSCVYLWK